MFEVAPRVGMCARHGLLRQLSGLECRLVAHVRQIDKDSETVHLSDEILTEPAQTLVRALVAAVADKVALVVRDLDDPHAQLMEQREPVKVILYWRRVLPPEHHANLALLLRLQNVVRSARLYQRVLVGLEPVHPPSHVVHGFAEVLPDRHCGVDARHSSRVQAPEHLRAVPVANVQPIEYDRLTIDIWSFSI